MSDNQSSRSWIIGLIIIAALAAAAYLFLSRGKEAPTLPPPTPEPETEAVVPELEPEPVEPPPEPAPAPEPKRQLPPLDASDQAVTADLESLAPGGGLAEWLVPDEVIRKWVAAVNTAARGELVAKHRPLKEIKTPFNVSGSKEEGYELSPENYQRYDQLVRLFALADTDTAINLYRFWYPRLAQAFGELGIKNKNFHQVLLEAIDQVLAAPQIDDPIKLVRPKVYYQFADPGLEKLPGIHKLMIRMGPENAARVKGKLEELKAELKQIPLQQK